MVPAVDGGVSGVGIMPGVHCQPAWQICPISQMLPGMHHADRVGGSGSVEVAGQLVPDGGMGTATHPVSRKARGQTRMCFPRNQEHYLTPAKLNQS
jgi:hypothetical protein